jgi:uncharacterized protein (TIGR02300 family)
MVKPELGQKRICVSCGTRFYDLGRTPASCPKCGTEQPPDQPKLRRGGNVVDRRAPKKAPVLDEAEAEAEVADEDAEEGVPEETDDLDDDADAIGGDLEVEPEDEAER